MVISQHDAAREQPHRIAIVCHKGANNVAPENTYAAARQAIAWGADVIEVDVWTTRDGEMVMLHDRTVDRTTDGSGHILALTLPEVRALDAGSWFSPRFAGERVPVLREFLQWIKGKAGIFFDVKFAHPQQLLDLIDEVGVRDECFIWSGSKALMKLIHELDDEIPLKVNVGSVDDVIAADKELGARIVEVRLDKMSPALVEACRERSIKVMINEMREDAEALRRVIAWEPDMVNLDHADLLLATLREASGSETT
ncbi:MAG: glycerophosphodiester phosphodiesterase [Anaerolineae bacterium]